MKTKVIETKPQDFYKIREDIRRKRKKKKVNSPGNVLYKEGKLIS